MQRDKKQTNKQKLNGIAIECLQEVDIETIRKFNKEKTNNFNIINAKRVFMHLCVLLSLSNEKLILI